MNIIKTLLIVLVLNFGFVMSASANYLNGNNFRQADELEKTGYVAGIVDSIQTLSNWGELTEPSILL